MYLGSTLVWPESSDVVLPDNGIYIYTNTREFYTVDEWDTSNNDLAIGVAIIDDDCQFVVSKNLELSETMPWSIELYGVRVEDARYTPSGISTATWYLSVEDYLGQTNTLAIYEANPDESTETSAVNYCLSKSIQVNNTNVSGYLPGAGEIHVLLYVWPEVASALSLIGDTDTSILNSNIPCWSSTLGYDGEYACAVLCGGSTSPSGAIVTSKQYDKTTDSNIRVLPVFPIN